MMTILYNLSSSDSTFEILLSENAVPMILSVSTFGATLKTTTVAFLLKPEAGRSSILSFTISGSLHH